jgi:outer membrane lipoprotein-sorting protein
LRPAWLIRRLELVGQLPALTDKTYGIALTMTSSFSCLIAAVTALAVTPATRAAEPPIIAKARAYLGSEAALEAVKSIHYTGTLVVSDGATPSKSTPAAMDMVFQKPYQQRVQATSATAVEVTALDGYDAWQRLQDPANPANWKQSSLGSDQIKRLRANTWENLWFFRGIERVGGRLEDQGLVTFEGIPCHKIAFVHVPAAEKSPGIIFYRYFEVATGRLVYTETEGGSTIREQGEMKINGVRFPKSMINSTKGADGKVRTLTITFDKITVNEVFPPTHFAVPPLTGK